MNWHRCPNCLEKAGTEIERSVIKAGLKRRFECQNCLYTWEVVF